MRIWTGAVKRYEGKEEKKKGGARKDYGKRTGKEGEKKQNKGKRRIKGTGWKEKVRAKALGTIKGLCGWGKTKIKEGWMGEGRMHGWREGSK